MHDTREVNQNATVTLKMNVHSSDTVLTDFDRDHGYREEVSEKCIQTS